MTREAEGPGAVAAVATAPGDNPRRVYQERLALRQTRVGELDRELDRLGQLRLAVFLGGLVLGWVMFTWKTLSPWWLAVPVLLFFGLMVRFDRVRRTWRRAKRAVRFYESGLERLQDRWPGKGNTGQRFLKDKHLYSQDLDIFGSGSLFERLSTARTRPGEETLARWLSAPATHKEIQARQDAIRELTPRLDLREDLSLLGSEVPPVDFHAILTWGSAPVQLTSTGWRIGVLISGFVNIVTVTGWLAFGMSSLPFVVSLLISLGVMYALNQRVQTVLQPVETMGRDLFLLAGLLSRLEKESFTAAKLNDFHAGVQVAGTAPSWQIARLAVLVDWLDALRNQFFLPIAILLLWRAQMAFAIEQWRKTSGPVIPLWVKEVAEIEALSSVASYAFENPEDPFPEIVDGPARLDGEDLGHPLLPRDHCVRNDVQLGDGIRVLVVSGSNMSGKSTLLRTIGTNTVLALAGAPVRAKRLRLTPLAVGATLRVQDSLLEGRSRFFAEITRIRDILDLTQQEIPVLFLLDELFHGTNSHDRGIGAEALLKRLLAAGAIGLLTTHDLTLTAITGKLGPQAKNVHFADQFVEGQMHFDYKMRPGVVPHSNALALMRAVGLEV